MRALRKFLFLVPIIFAASAAAQPRVGLNHTHLRLMAIVPMTGAGTVADPVRPLFAPAAKDMPAALRSSSLLGWSYTLSDDGKWALVEFVARDRAAFASILADKRYRVF
jgi:hypothetical protein